MRWLDSTLGLDDSVPAPFIPLTSHAPSSSSGSYVLSALGKDLTLDPTTGLPMQVTTRSSKMRRGQSVMHQYSMLASSMRLEVVPASGSTPLVFTAASPVQVDTSHSDTLTWTCTSTAPVPASSRNRNTQRERGQDGEAVHTSAQSETATPAVVQVRLVGALDFDSYISLNMTVEVLQGSLNVSDIRVVIPLNATTANYLVGLDQPGRPVAAGAAQWLWNAAQAYNSLWVGRVEAGLFVMPKGSGTRWNNPLFSKDSPVIPFIPPSWGGVNASTQNSTNTGVLVSNGSVTIWSGPRQLRAGVPVEYLLDLALTPSKPINWTTHWKGRIFQVGYGTNYISPQDVRAGGASIVTLHQGVSGVINGSLVNPYINYPFGPDVVPFLANYSEQAHALGMGFKFYYTVRELSNHAAELYPLLSLRGEVIPDSDPNVVAQPGYCQEADCRGGAVYLHEHLLQNYSSCWQQGLGDGEIDAAVCDTGSSRWINYYIEGVGWSVGQKPYLDGIYYDGINFDRSSMRRIRKTLVAAHARRSVAKDAQVSIDVHTGHDPRRRPAVAYLSHFPCEWVGLC